MESVRHLGSFNNGIDVSIEGIRGGLCLGWKERVMVSLKSFSQNHIDVDIDEEDMGKNGGLRGSMVPRIHDLSQSLGNC